MANYTVSGGNILSLDETFSGVINSLQVLDGICNITNETNNGLLLEFASGAFISVESFGQLNVRGKMITLGTGDGSLGQSVNHWQNTSQINVIWVETANGSDAYEPWFCLNPPNVSSLDFDLLGDGAKGRFYKWNNGAIEFSNMAGKGEVPVSGAKIVAPNILFSTTAPFTSTVAGRYMPDLGGHLSIKNASFADFACTFRGMGHLDMEGVGLHGSAYIQYCDDFQVTDTHAGLYGLFNSGLTFSYVSNGTVDKVSAASVKSQGLSFSYLKDIVANNITGIILDRDGFVDAPFYFKSVQASDFSGLTSIGGVIFCDAVSDVEFAGIELSDQPSGVESASVAAYNISVDSSSNLIFRGTNVPNGGGAKLGVFSIKDSPNVDIIDTTVETSFGNTLVYADVSFNTRISNFTYAGYAGSKAFDFLAKNNGLLMQKVQSTTPDVIDIEPPNVIMKGVEASSIVTDNPRMTNFNFAQVYTNPTDGKLMFIMSKNNIGTFYENRVGDIRWSNNSRVYFRSMGDTIEIITPYNIKGATLKNAAPVINGSNTSTLAIDYSIFDGNSWSGYKGLVAGNLGSEVIDKDEGFMLKLRIVAGTISQTTYINTIELETQDDRFLYPLNYEVGKLVFNDIVELDPEARYYVYYANNYGTDLAEMVKDADGTPVTGIAGGKTEIEFSYDFAGDTGGGRTPGAPTDMVVVVSGKSTAAPVVISQTFDEGQVNVFNIRATKEFAYLSNSPTNVSFDGASKLIIVSPGVNSLQVRSEIYSAWKDWLLTGDNSKYNIAFNVIGGNPLPESQLGLTYFLQSGWLIRPYEGDHRLTIKGNLYREDGSDPIADTIGDYKVTVSMRVSNLIDMINVNGTSGTGGTGGTGGTTPVEVDTDSIDGITTTQEWTIITN